MAGDYKAGLSAAPSPAAQELASALSDGYSDLNEVERRLVDRMVGHGLTREKAMKYLNQDLDAAAEEDGYDGP